ncbi:MAG: LuxR C-terminal-related transcriptional regulator [Chloroflexota bacterium]|nr:LuxR C-terminal-related transcriptional regulator [Chloroflexota bacterium]
MSERGAFDRILASMHEAMLDDAHWLPTFALIDDTCRTKGNMLTFAERSTQDDVEMLYARFCFRGEHNRELEREYFADYLPRDERIPRVRKLPDSQLFHVPDLYTDQELRTSAAYNEMLPAGESQNGLNVRLDGPGGSRIVWGICDPVATDGWSSDQLDMIRRLLPHIRQYVRVRQALGDAGAMGSSLARLLDNTRFGVIQLARRGQIVAINDLARDLLREGDALLDRNGYLHARSPADDDDLQRLLARVLPRGGAQGTSASMLVKRRSILPRLVLHLSPVGDGQIDFRPRRVAALALIVDPALEARIDPDLVMAALDLTPAESQVAVLLAEGRTPQQIAAATGRRESTIRWHVQKIFVKHGISRQAELVRLVSPLAGIPLPQQSGH